MRFTECRFIVVLIICCLFASCEQMAGWFDGNNDYPFTIERYDRLQNELGVTGNFSTMQRMNTDFPKQTQILVEDVLELGSVTDADMKEKLEICLSDTAMLILMADGERKFSDMHQLNRDFGNALKRMAKELPQLPQPKVYAQFSGLNESVVVSDTLVGFSIDKYMGVDYPLYKKYFYDNQIATMIPERIVSDCVFYYLRDNYPLPETSTGTLLDNMVHLGIINWITRKLTDSGTIEKMLGYSSEDEQWVKDNFQAVVDYVMSFQHSTDPQVLRNLLSPTYTVTINGQKAPSFLGTWLGYQMVSHYMKNRKNLSVQQLAETDDLSAIVSAYNYKLN